MMNKNVYTQVSALSAVVTILNSLDVSNEGILLVGNEEIDVTALTEKVEGMRETILNRKRTPSKADKAKVAEQNAIMDAVMDVLIGAEGGMTISAMQKESATLAELTNQKISAMLRKMIADGRIVKTMDKKKAIFSLALDGEGVEDEDEDESAE